MFSSLQQHLGGPPRRSGRERPYVLWETSARNTPRHTHLCLFLPPRRVVLVPYLQQLKLCAARLVEDDLGEPVAQPSAGLGLSGVPLSGSRSLLLADGRLDLAREGTQGVHRGARKPAARAGSTVGSSKRSKLSLRAHQKPLERLSPTRSTYCPPSFQRTKK